MVDKTMNVELKVVGRLLDAEGKTLSKMDLKDIGPATSASCLGRELGLAVGSALELICKKGPKPSQKDTDL